MENIFKRTNRTEKTQQTASLLSEEIADLTEIIADEQMSDKSRQKLTARAKELSEKRNFLKDINHEN